VSATEKALNSILIFLGMIAATRKSIKAFGKAERLHKRVSVSHAGGREAGITKEQDARPALLFPGTGLAFFLSGNAGIC
jgi:hypothetical protein